MIDSTNPRIMADNIRKLFAKPTGTVVEGNPSGSGFNTLLTKIKIGSHKYKIPDAVVANPEGELTGNLSKIGIGSGIYPVTNGVAYSNDEFDTGDKWIDGSPIYGKVYTPASAIQLSTQGLGTDITSIITNVSDISLIIEASAHLEESSLYLPIAADISNGDISAYTFVNASVDVIVLKYTKTTSE